MDILVAKLWALACFLVIHGSASVNLVEGIADILSNATVLIDMAPYPVEQPVGTTVQPPPDLPPVNSPPSPEMPEGPISSAPPTIPSLPGTAVQPPPNLPPVNSPPSPEMSEGPLSSAPPTVPLLPPSHLPVPPPTITQDPVLATPPTPPPENPSLSAPPPAALPIPAIPFTSPPDKPDVNSSAPAATPPSPNQTKPPESNAPPVPVAPVSSTPPSPTMPQSPPPYHPVLPNEPPSLPPEPGTSVPPSIPVNASPPVKPELPVDPPSSSPEQNVPPAIPRNVSPPPFKPPLPVEPPSSPPEQNVPPAIPRNVSPPVKPPPLPVEPPSGPPEQNVPPAIPTNASPPVKPPLPVEPPSSPPEQNAPPAISGNASPPVKPQLPVEPPSSPPEQNVPPAISRNLSPPIEPQLPVDPPSSPPEQNAPPAISRNASPPAKAPLPVEPPSSPPEQNVPISRNVSPPVKSPLPLEPPCSPPDQNIPSAFTPHPSTSPQRATTPLPAPHTNKSSYSYPPVSHSPSKGPPPSKPVSNSTRGYNISPSPSYSLHAIPPASRKPAHMNYSRSAPSIPHNAPPPTSAGSPTSSTPNVSPSHSANFHNSPTAAPSPRPLSGHTKISPELSPLGTSSRHPKTHSPPPPPWQALPPPPPQKDCAPLICTEPLTYGPPEYPCVCVLPIQVELRLGVALYTFFPLVSELASEIAAGVFMKQSQVRIMGANAAEDNPDKTIVLIDLVPVGQKFDDTKAYLTFQRLWQKQVPITPTIFGDYDVLYVRYPGLPPSPPLPPSTTAIITKPYPGHSNDPQKPIGVDARGKQHGNGPRGSIMATILLSAFVAAILLCVIAWILLFRNRDRDVKSDPTPPNTARSQAKSSAVATSMVGSGPSSPAFSLGSSIVGYTGSTKTFTSADIEAATDNFDETRVLGEGGFGRVYSGVLEDGTKIAVKILKRYDQQGNREFLAEVEMLTRLHHRNLVKLIGICTEAKTRCLVYELISNGSVDSHLHGIDKEAAPLDWSARLKIALGAARALAYLHEDSSPRVIHRDFKASNILLEDDYTPKVSDFGLARTALDGDNKHISTRVMGTFGYVAPEYAMTGHLLVKSDVYSYGVVLLELLTGKKPVDMSQPPGQENLVAWARPLMTTQEGLQSMIDPCLGPDCPFDSIAKVSAIASMCVQPEVSHRPFMGEVVQALKLVSNECDRMRELSLPRNPAQEESPRSSINSDQTPDHQLLNQSPVSSYDYRLDCERDLTMSELLSSSAQYDRQDSSSYRRHSSSGPIRPGKTKQLWKTIGRLSGGSVSEHGVLFRLWPGSH